MFRREERLTHELCRHYPALRAIRTRRALLASPLHAEIASELARVLGGVERAEHAGPRAGHAEGSLRAVAWNIQRGRHLPRIRAALMTHPLLGEADVILLSEVDSGMGRSGNLNVARELAGALGMHYAFAVSYLVLEDDLFENPDGVENTLALAGTAVLSRYPMGRVENVDLPEIKDKFSSSEKRLGKKRALLAELMLPGGPLLVGACHLDSNAGPGQRAAQLDALLARADALQVPRALIGGDMNTSTYDASSRAALFRDLLHKLVVTGFRRTVEGYMTPELCYEQPVFEVMARHGFTHEGFNQRERGTYRYDLSSPFAMEKVRRKVGGMLTRALQRRLKPWGGVVPARLDWFFGKGVSPRSSAVVDVEDGEAPPISDHAAIVVDIAL